MHHKRFCNMTSAHLSKIEHLRLFHIYLYGLTQYADEEIIHSISNKYAVPRTCPEICGKTDARYYIRGILDMRGILNIPSEYTVPYLWLNIPSCKELRYWKNISFSELKNGLGLSGRKVLDFLDDLYEHTDIRTDWDVLRNKETYLQWKKRMDS